MHVNGEEINTSVKDLQSFLISMGYDPTRVAVEHNGKVIPRIAFEQTQILESDSLEIVCFVGGG